VLAWLKKLFRPGSVEYRRPDDVQSVAPVAPPNPSAAATPVVPLETPADEGVVEPDPE
jgi:hypothetical protein